MAISVNYRGRSFRYLTKPDGRGSSRQRGECWPGCGCDDPPDKRLARRKERRRLRREMESDVVP